MDSTTGHALAARRRNGVLGAHDGTADRLDSG